MKVWLILLVAVLSACAVCCVDEEGTNPMELRGEESRGLVDMSADLRELQTAFNSARGKVRVILIVSPG